MNIGLHVLRRNFTKLLIVSGSIAALMTVGLLMDRAFADSEQEQVQDGQHIVSIHDRGQERVIVTKARTIRQALKAANINIHEGRDVVEPGLNTELITSKYSVNIYRARPVTIVDGLLRQRIMTAEQTHDRIAKAAGVDLFKEDRVTIGAAAELLIDGPSIVMTIHRSTPVSLTLYGKKSEVRTQAATVGEFLKEKKISLGKNDFLSVAATDKIYAGMAIDLWREGRQTLTQEEEVDFPVEKIQDANREVGYREVREAGVRGARNVTYEIEMRNGQEVSRKEIASVATKEPKKQVEVVGAKNVTMAYTGGGTKSDWLAASNIPADQWGYADWLVQRESGWNPNAVNRSSGACGLGQQLPCGKWAGAWNDPVVGLNGMHGYVMGRYGSWEAAVAHSKSRGWY